MSKKGLAHAQVLEKLTESLGRESVEFRGSFMLFESNRGFSAFDTLTLVGSVVILVLIIGPIMNRRVDQEYASIALRQAQDWTQKIPLNEKLSEKDLRGTGNRLPASDESADAPAVGADPWGRPYHYHYIRNSHGQPVYIAVWSAGPNSLVETNEADLFVTKEGSLSVKFAGDDVGFVKALR
jgi:hypothetical protein